MMRERVIWRRRHLTSGVHKHEREFSGRYVRHLSESVPAVYYMVPTPLFSQKVYIKCGKCLILVV